MSNSIIAALDQIAQEKKLSREEVLSALEKALATAYRKDFGKQNQNIVVEFDPESAKINVFDEKIVVEDVILEPEEEKGKQTKKEINKIEEEQKQEEKKDEEEGINEEEKEGKKRFNPRTEIQISEAKKINKKIKVGQILRQELPSPSEFGRIAAQTAKQVIVQKLRESEREKIYNNYKGKEGTIVDGAIQRQEKSSYLVDLGDALGVFPPQEQIFSERYSPSQKLKFYIVSVETDIHGPEIILSRRHPSIVEELFKLEIPEIMEGKVKVKGISRQPGERSKVAVFTKEKDIDPIGAAIGQRGVRIQTIISELGGEKIDIIEYSEDPAKFIVNALSPAKINSIILNEKEKIAKVKVTPNQLSLVIGKGGQNVKLASQLTGWKIEIEKEEEKKEEEKKEEEKKEEKEEEEKKEEGKKEEKGGKEEKKKEEDKKEEGREKEKKKRKKEESKKPKEKKD